MEIEVSRRTLKTLVFILSIGLTLAILYIIGDANTPRLEGRPLFLSRDRLLIYRYLSAAGEWAAELEEVARELDTVVPPELEGKPAPAHSALPSPPSPVSRPEDIFALSRKAGEALACLQEVGEAVQRTEPPPTLQGLHQLFSLTVSAYARWASDALNYVGAPDPNVLKELRKDRAEALKGLEEIKRAIQVHRAAMGG